MNKKKIYNFPNNWFYKISKKLINGSFKFRSAKKITFIKTDNAQLLFNNYKDKIVYQAITMLLENIYEKKILDTSNDFRPSENIHSALEMIRLNWTGISWFLEFDIEKSSYNNTNFQRLLNILQEDIEDQRFLDLIHKLLNTGIINLNENFLPFLFKSVSQIPILSPIFLNIYFNKLDIEIATCS